MLYWFWNIMACVFIAVYVYTTEDVAGAVGIMFWVLYYNAVIRMEGLFDGLLEKFRT